MGWVVVVGDIFHMLVISLVIFGYVLLCAMKLEFVWQVLIGLILFEM